MEVLGPQHKIRDSSEFDLGCEVLLLWHCKQIILPSWSLDIDKLVHAWAFMSVVCIQ